MAVRTLRENKRESEKTVTERGQTLPEYLRQLRISSHYRQSFVASQLNISRQTYSHYETGRIRPPAGALYRLSRLYGIPVEELLSKMCSGRYGLENRERSPKQEEYLRDEGNLEMRLLSHFRSLNKGEQEDILSMIEMKIKNKEGKENQDAERKVTV